MYVCMYTSQGPVDMMPSEGSGNNGLNGTDDEVPSECSGDHELSEGSGQMVPPEGSENNGPSGTADDGLSFWTCPLFFDVIEGLKKLVSLGTLAAAPCSSSSRLRFILSALGMMIN